MTNMTISMHIGCISVAVLTLFSAVSTFKISDVLMKPFIPLRSQLKYIIFVDDAFPMLKVHLKEMDDGDKGCKCTHLPKIFQGSGEHDDTDADTEDTVGKEDLLALEDKVMKKLDGVNEKLDNFLKAIQKR